MIRFSWCWFERGVTEAGFLDYSRQVTSPSRPIVFDNSLCACRIRRMLAGRLAVQDAIKFIHDRVLPRVRLAPIEGPVAAHPVCSARKTGLADPLAATVARCTSQALTADEVPCCGFAGDRGCTQPELNAPALRHLEAALPAGCTSGVPSSRACEIRLSEFAGVRYRSLIEFVDGCAMPLEAAVEVSA